MRKFLLLLSISIFTTIAYSQTGNIRGFVYDKNSAEPIMFCNVILQGTTIGASTSRATQNYISFIQK